MENLYGRDLRSEAVRDEGKSVVALVAVVEGDGGVILCVSKSLESLAASGQIQEVLDQDEKTFLDSRPIYRLQLSTSFLRRRPLILLLGLCLSPSRNPCRIMSRHHPDLILCRRQTGIGASSLPQPGTAWPLGHKHTELYTDLGPQTSTPQPLEECVKSAMENGAC